MSFSNLQTAKEYAFAGQATLTLESRRTGNHHTYRISECKDPEAKGLFFVSHLISGSADEGNFAYLGIVKEGRFRTTKKSTASEEAPSVQAFIFFMKSKELHPLLVVHHENKCGRCGRTLTVPESVESGLGPECRSKMS